ncbi:hypothetical protein [Vibrio sp. H11]|uniref:hypothetical protein n=1 Tax=Vibrio sp. H11 TaxID=2565928 RepID=UPI0010A61E90|nr:hypothetical protein [Vibrio sp. H11]
MKTSNDHSTATPESEAQVVPLENMEGCKTLHAYAIKLERERNELASQLTTIIDSKEANQVKDWAICGIYTNSVEGTEGRETRMAAFKTHYHQRVNGARSYLASIQFEAP